MYALALLILQHVPVATFPQGAGMQHSLPGKSLYDVTIVLLSLSLSSLQHIPLVPITPFSLHMAADFAVRCAQRCMITIPGFDAWVHDDLL